MSNTITPTVFYRTLNVEEFGGQSSLSTVSGLGNSLVSIISSDLLRLSSSEKMKMPRDGARVPSFSKKASPKRSTIKCVRHPGQTRRATNQSHNSRARFACHVPSRGAFLFYALLRIADHVQHPIQKQGRPVSNRRGGQ